jgi:hypothetical protein
MLKVLHSHKDGCSPNETSASSPKVAVYPYHSSRMSNERGTLGHNPSHYPPSAPQRRQTSQMHDSLSTNLVCNIYYSKLFTSSGYKSVSKTKGLWAYVSDKRLGSSGSKLLVDLYLERASLCGNLSYYHFPCENRDSYDDRSRDQT